MIGNFIADFVKGNKKNNYPEGIKAGIELHRSIDDYTDHHELTSISKKRLYPTQHKYAGPVVDVFYDHFLAKNFLLYSEIPLDIFTLNAYQVLQSNQNILPPEVQQFLPYMIERNWLLNYSTLDGIERSLKGISRRLSFQNNLNSAKDDLVEHYSEFEKEFFQFFPQLINFVNSITR